MGRQVRGSPKKGLRKRYNKMVVIDLEKRAVLRDLIKRNTKCQHKQIYTQANAICRRISSSYEEGKISGKQALVMMLEAHDQMSHRDFPKEVIAGEMNKRLDKLEKGETVTARAEKEIKVDERFDKYSEGYWAEVI